MGRDPGSQADAHTSDPLTLLRSRERERYAAAPVFQGTRNSRSCCGVDRSAIQSCRPAQTNQIGSTQMIRTMLTMAAVAVGVTIAIAQSDPIAQRKALMKGNAQHAGAMGRMVRGEEPFEFGKVNAAFEQWTETAQKLPGRSRSRRSLEKIPGRCLKFGKTRATSRPRSRLSARRWPTTRTRRRRWTSSRLRCRRSAMPATIVTNPTAGRRRRQRSPAKRNKSSLISTAGIRLYFVDAVVIPDHDGVALPC